MGRPVRAASMSSVRCRPRSRRPAGRRPPGADDRGAAPWLFERRATDHPVDVVTRLVSGVVGEPLSPAAVAAEQVCTYLDTVTQTRISWGTLNKGLTSASENGGGSRSHQGVSDAKAHVHRRSRVSLLLDARACHPCSLAGRATRPRYVRLDSLGIAVANGNFTTLRRRGRVCRSAVATALTSGQQLTVFAPTDQAFLASPFGPLTAANVCSVPQGVLTDILLYHVEPGRHFSNSVLPPRRPARARSSTRFSASRSRSARTARSGQRAG